MNARNITHRFNPHQWSLRVRLSIVMVLLVIVTLAGVTFVTIQAVRTTLTNQIGDNFAIQTVGLNDLIRIYLQQKVSQLQTLAVTHTIHEAAHERHDTYSGSPEDILAQIKTLDTAWQSAADDDPLVLDIIANDEERNPAAHQLAAFLEEFPDHTELIITDQYGATVAATGRLADYYQADETWWQTAWNDGQGAIFISNPLVDESANIYALLLAVPVFNDETGEVVGVLRSTLNVDTLARLIAGKTFGQTGQAMLLDKTGQVLFGPSFNTIGGSNGFAANLQQHIFEHPPGTMSMVWPDQENELSMFGHAHLNKGTFEERAIVEAEKQVDEAIANLQWVAVIQQKADEAFVSVEQVAQISLIAGVIAIVLAAIVALIVARTITGPLVSLGVAAERIGQGNLDIPLPKGGNDEVGRLTNSFKEMTIQLKQTFAEMESQNRQRIQELEIIAEISRQMTMVLDLDELLPQVVASIEHIFGNHQVFVYLVDQHNNLVMRQGTGVIGQQLKEQSYKVEMGYGLIGTVGRTGQYILANDVSQDDYYVTNVLLPDTHSELATPLRKGETVLGVLDIQSKELHSFTSEDVILAQSIADQLGTAIDNVQLFQEARQAAAAAEELARRLTRETWQNISHSIVSNAYAFTQTGTDPAPNAWLPAMEAAVLQKELVYSSVEVHANEQNNTPTSVAVPLILRGDVIGVLGLERPADYPWRDDELTTIQAITEQIALALDSARLAQETERSAWRDRLISESTAQVWSSSEIEEVMRTAVAQLGSKLRASEVVIQLGSGATFSLEE